MKNIALYGKNLNVLSDIRLVDSSERTLAIASVSGNEKATFSNINKAIGSLIQQDKSGTFYVIANINSGTNQMGVHVDITLNVRDFSNFIASDGSVIPLTGTDVK